MTERCDRCRKKRKDNEHFNVHSGLNPHFNLCEKCEDKWDEFRSENLIPSDSTKKWSECIKIFLNNEKEIVKFT